MGRYDHQDKIIKRTEMNILTFDIEDWWAYDYYSIGRKEDYLPRLNQYLNRILDFLDEKNIQATFFCLGKVAE